MCFKYSFKRFEMCVQYNNKVSNPNHAIQYTSTHKLKLECCTSENNLQVFPTKNIPKQVFDFVKQHGTQVKVVKIRHFYSHLYGIFSLGDSGELWAECRRLAWLSGAACDHITPLHRLYCAGV